MRTNWARRRSTTYHCRVFWLRRRVISYRRILVCTITFHLLLGVLIAWSTRHLGWLRVVVAGCGAVRVEHRGRLATLHAATPAYVPLVLRVKCACCSPLILERYVRCNRALLWDRVLILHFHLWAIVESFDSRHRYSFQVSLQIRREFLLAFIDEVVDESLLSLHYEQKWWH